MKFRTILLGIAALFLAGCAAYFSVLGLSKLFAGASTAVILMASSLEFAKLITAGFLYNYWENINKILRTYLLIGTLVLVTITSAGIYGFLTSAYQTTADQLTTMDKQIELVDLKKGRYQEQLNDYSAERDQLNNTIGELSKGLSNNSIQYKDKETGQIITTTSSATRKVLTAQLNDSKIQRDKVAEKMDILNDSITAMDIRALDIKSNNDVAAEVGPLKYLSNITGLPMNKIVNGLTLFIIFVFDPLAVTLIVAFNTALRTDKGVKDKKLAESKRSIYGEEEDDDSIYEWDGIGPLPVSESEIKARKEATELVKKVNLARANEIVDADKAEQEKLLEEIMKRDQEIGLYDMEYEDDSDDSEMPPQKEVDKIIEEENNDTSQLAWKQLLGEENVEPNEALLQAADRYKEFNGDINDIDVVDEEIVLPPVDMNNDGVITPEEQRAHYESHGWRLPYQGRPYYHHPWFDWNTHQQRWINDPHAVDFYKKYRGGNQQTIDKFRNLPYPTDFDSKTY